MKIFSAQLKGTTIVASGSSATITGSFTGSIAGIDINATNTFTSSTIARLNSIEIITSSNVARLNAVETITSSNVARLNAIETITSSNIARLNSIEIVSASNISRIGSLETISASNISRISALETTSASVDTLNTTQNTRLTNLEIKTGSLATTGSNTFIGTQTITGSLFISSNLIVQGTSSLQNITASAVSIGTNLINLNTANPAIRYAGLVIGDSGSVGGSGSFLYDSVQDEMLFIHRGDSSVVTSSVTLMGPETYDNLGNEIYLTNNRLPKGTGKEHLVDSNISDDGTQIRLNSNTEITGSLLISGTISVPGQNIITRSGGGETTELSFFNGSNTIGGTSALIYAFPKLTLGLSTSGNNEDYNLLIQRHGTSLSPGAASSIPALQVLDYAGDGHCSYQVTGIVDIVAPRISNIDTNAGNINLLRVANDDGTALHISGKNRVFIGKTSQTDNGQQLQVNGTSRFDGCLFVNDKYYGLASLSDNILEVINTNTTAGYGLYVRAGGTDSCRYVARFKNAADEDVMWVGKKSVGIGAPSSDCISLFIKGNSVDSPQLRMEGICNPVVIMGDTTTGTTDTGFINLYNEGTLRIRLDTDTAGLSYINANRFIVGATTSTNAKFRVRHDDTDATYTSKIQAVFGPSDYLDSDAVDVFGGGTSETQFTNGSTSRPAMISLGGSLNTAEALGVINFFRSGNTDNYRSRVQLWAGVQSTGTANQHGGYLEIRTANDGVAAPAALAQFEARGSFLLYRRDDNMTFADSVGALYVRQNGNHDSTQEEFRIVGRNIGFFSHTGTRHAGVNSCGVLGIGYGGTPAATSKIFISRSDQYGLHLDAGSGYARIQTTDDNLYLKVGSNDMVTINCSAITMCSTVTPSNVSTPNFTIIETGVSKSVTGYNYDATQPMVMVITQTAATTLGLTRASEDAVGSTLRGFKARCNALNIASPLNGDDIFSVEGWAWHGSGPNYPKLGGGMKFVKDDNWGTASTRAPMRTEFYNANSTTTTQTTLIIYPSGNASLTGTLTQSASDIRLKTNVTKIENALCKINQLEGFTYNWNTLSPLYNCNITNKEVGVSAQAVKEVLPEVVSLAPFDVDKLDSTKSKSGENYLTIQYEKLVPLLIEGMKEQQCTINLLKSCIGIN